MESIIFKLRNNIIQAFKEAADKAKASGQINFEELPDFVLEKPREKAHGDFAINLAMVLTKQARMNPRQIAQVLIDNLDSKGTWIEKIEIAGPGFINLFLDNAWMYEVLPEVVSQQEKYGNSSYGSGKKVQVEFVSANPTGLLHMGNARGAAIGDTLANLLAASGYEVTKEFYINDAGNQIENFGKSLEVRYLQLMGQEVVFPDEGYHGQDIIDTMKALIDLDGDKYVTMDSSLRKEMLVKFALKDKLHHIKSTLETFGVEYDVWFSEQSLHDSGAIEAVLNDLKDRGYIYENEGALWFKSTEFGDEKDEVVVRSNGTPTYFAADIAYHKNKFDRGFDWVINIWGADHHGHVARMKGSVKAVGYDSDSLDVILMQLVRLFQGGEIVRMSKRSGRFITLADLIEEVGKDAARYFFVMRSSDSHLDFDMDLAKSQSSDNPVYYVQYAHARICSILTQACEQGVNLPQVNEVDFSKLNEEQEIELIKKLAELPEEILGAAKAMEPHRIARYVHELASAFHSFYNSCRVICDDDELQKARLLLVEATRVAIKNTLTLMGLSAPERM